MSHYSISLCQHKIKLKKGLRLCWKNVRSSCVCEKVRSTEYWEYLLWKWANFSAGKPSLSWNLSASFSPGDFNQVEHFQNSLPTHFLFVKTRSSLSSGSFSPLREPWPTYLCFLGGYLQSGGEKIILTTKEKLFIWKKCLKMKGQNKKIKVASTLARE